MLMLKSPRIYIFFAYINFLNGFKKVDLRKWPTRNSDNYGCCFRQQNFK